MASKPRKPTLQWTIDSWGTHTYAVLWGDDRGRVVPSYKYDCTVTRVIAHVWGPDADSTATESITFTPDPENPQSTLIQKALTWVEERIKFLDQQ